MNDFIASPTFESSASDCLISTSQFTTQTRNNRIRDRGLFMAGGGGGGVAPKRKGLGKKNFEPRVKGWVTEKQNNSRVGYKIFIVISKA